jgi:glucan 1,3-beta-glucosidase
MVIELSLFSSYSRGGGLTILHRPIDEATWESEKNAILNAIPSYKEQVYGITVGSEGIYRFNTNQTGGYNDIQLTGWLADAIKTWPNIPIGTADTAYSYSDGTMDNAIKLAPRIL